MTTKIDPKKIRMETDTQSRVEINQSIVDEYAESMQRGEEFPPILVYYDEAIDHFIVVDGWHRFLAHLKIRPNDWIMAEQRLGSFADARWESFGVNKTHGLRRTNADKHKAAVGALSHPKGNSLSNRQIAAHVGVAESTVRLIRKELESTAQIAQSTSRTGQDGRTINTANIGGKSVHYSDSRKLYCDYCQHHREGHCELTDEPQPIYHPACGEFLERAAIPADEEVPQHDMENTQIIHEIPNKKPRKRKLHSYSKRGYLKIGLPPDNAQLFVCELRQYFSTEYLTECLTALKYSLLESDKDDPYPNLT